MFLRFLFCSCAAFALTAAQAQDFTGLSNGSILICKDSQCIPSAAEMGHLYLVNQINELMKNNIGKNITLCEASPDKYSCTEQGFSFPVQSDMIKTSVSLPTARIIDAKPLEDGPGTDLIIDYRLKAGDTFPRCQTSLSRMGVASAVDVKMMSPQFNCKVTETNKTTFSITYNVNYLDLDRGIIGAFYTVAANNALQGKKDGYVLMTLEKGVQMEPGEVFPYVAQLKAILNGSMPQINDPEIINQMEAFWLKPTPFLNLSTPQFAPNNCIDFVGGCSAEMLNNPEIAVPPAAEQIARLTPAGVPSTTGLIQQKIEITNRTRILGQNEKLQLINGTVSSAQMMKNGEKEYQSLKQFEAKNMPTELQQPAPQPAAQAQAPQAQAPQAQPTQAPAQAQAQVQAQAPQAQQASAQAPQAKTPVQILTQPGVTLSPEEKAYIESLAQTAEGQPIPQVQIDAQSDLIGIVDVSNAPSATAQGTEAPTMPVASVVSPDQPTASTIPAASVSPVKEFSAPVYVVPTQNVQPVQQQPVVISPANAPVKENEDTSMWSRMKKGISKLFYW